MDYCSYNTLEVWEESEVIVIVAVVVDRVHCRSIAVVVVVTGSDIDWKIEVIAERRSTYLSVVAGIVAVLWRTPVAAAATSMMTLVAVAEVAAGFAAGVVAVAVERMMMMSMLLNPERLLQQDIHHQDHCHRR